MSFRKIILLLLCLGLIPFSCFRPKYPYYTIHEISLASFKDFALSNPIVATDSLTGDSVILALKLETEFVAHLGTPGIAGTCFATTKPSNGDYGLKDDEVTGVNIVCDKSFNSIPPGGSLNNQFRFLRGTNHAVETEQLTSVLNSHSPALYPETTANLRMLLAERPGGSGSFRFELVLNFKSGNVRSAATTVTWK